MKDRDSSRHANAAQLVKKFMKKIRCTITKKAREVVHDVDSIGNRAIRFNITWTCCQESIFHSPQRVRRPAVCSRGNHGSPQTPSSGGNAAPHYGSSALLGPAGWPCERKPPRAQLVRARGGVPLLSGVWLPLVCIRQVLRAMSRERVAVGLRIRPRRVEIQLHFQDRREKMIPPSLAEDSFQIPVLMDAGHESSFPQALNMTCRFGDVKAIREFTERSTFPHRTSRTPLSSGRRFCMWQRHHAVYFATASAASVRSEAHQQRSQR